MDFSKLITISGKSDIFIILNQKNDGIIARSLETKKASFFPSRKSKVMFLRNIEVYSNKEQMILLDVFKSIQSSKEPFPENTTNEKVLDDYFNKVNDNMNLEKISLADKQKMIQWYQILLTNNIDF